MMAETGEMEDYQSLTRTGKVKRVLPKVLPILLLSVILPTADVGTDLALITKLYRGLEAVCVQSDIMDPWKPSMREELLLMLSGTVRR